MIPGRVTEQGGADDVGVASTAAAGDPRRHPQQVVHVRLALLPAGGVPRLASCSALRACSGPELSRSGGLSAANRARSPCSPYMAVMTCSGMTVTSFRPASPTSCPVTAEPTTGVPGRSAWRRSRSAACQLLASSPPDSEGLIAGLGDREGDNLAAAVQAAGRGQGKPALVRRARSSGPQRRVLADFLPCPVIIASAKRPRP